MDLGKLLIDLADRGVQIRREGDELSVRAPKGALTRELHEQLVRHKAGLLELLRLRDARASGAAASAPPPFDQVAEAQLDPAIQPGPPQPPRASPAAIMLTGATGFLGAFLLRDLLEHTGAQVHCLVRADSPEGARQRLRRVLETYQIWQPGYAARIEPLVGDLSSPLLGLGQAHFDALAAEVDLIVHNGALVNYLHDYHALKTPNVLGTQEVLRLAAQTRVKPVHCISSIGVFPVGGKPDSDTFYEDEPLEQLPLPTGGYTQSKRVADLMAANAHRRGIPVAVYRPGLITGHSQTGVYNTDDVLYRMLKGCHQLGVAPAVEMSVNAAPVDYVSQAIVHLAQQPDALGRVFHLVNPQSASWVTTVEWMEGLGFPMRLVPFEEWQAHLRERAGTDHANALYPLVPMLTETEMTPELQQRLEQTTFDCGNTVAGLAGSGIACPAFDAALLETYVDYFVRAGLLDAPLGARRA